MSEGNDREIVLLYLSPYNFLGHSVVVYARDNRNLQYPLYIILLFAQHNNAIPMHPLVHVAVMTDNEPCYIYYNICYIRVQDQTHLQRSTTDRVLYWTHMPPLSYYYTIFDVMILQ